MPIPTAPPADGLPDGPRRLAIAVIAIGTTMAVLDGSIANVALPTISRELHVDAAASVWVVNAYQLAVAVLLLPLSSLGDVIGYRRVYASGIALFTLASLACALSPTLPILILARVIQGIGGAGIMSIAPALNRSIFPAAKLGVAVGISALTVASSAAAGPTIGGALLAIAPWPWLFAINVPIGFFDTVFSARALPPGEPSGGRFDLTSALLSGPALALVVIALDGFAASPGRSDRPATRPLRRHRLRFRTSPAEARPSDAPARALRHSPLLARRRDVAVLVLRAGPRLRRAAVPRPVGLRLLALRVRLAVHAVAARHRRRGSDRGPARRPAASTRALHDRTRNVRGRSRGVRGPSRARIARGNHRLRHPLRARIRILPGAEQPRAARLGPAQPQRGGFRRSRDRARHRPITRRGGRGDRARDRCYVARSGSGDAARTGPRRLVDRRCMCARRHGGQRHPVTRITSFCLKIGEPASRLCVELQGSPSRLNRLNYAPLGADVPTNELPCLYARYLERYASAMMAAGRSDFERQRYIETLSSLGRHPNTGILRALVDGPRRFNELTADLAGVPEPLLSAGLRELDADGLVVRRVDPGPPLRVLYELTAAGIELGPALRALATWCERI